MRGERQAIDDFALAYQEGGAWALAALHEQLRPAIFAVLRRLLTDRLPATLDFEDLQQQTWVLLGELAARWQPRGPFLAYFLASFERELRRFVARSRSHRGQVSVLMVPHAHLIEQIDHHHEGRNRPEEAALTSQLLSMLPSPERRAVELFVLEAWSCQAIGAELGVSAATAHRLAQRGIARLAKELA